MRCVCAVCGGSLQQPPPAGRGDGGGWRVPAARFPARHSQSLDVIGHRVSYVKRHSIETLLLVPPHVPHRQALFGRDVVDHDCFACGACLVVQPAQRIKVHDVRVFHCDVDVHLLLHLADCAVQYLFRRA